MFGKFRIRHGIQTRNPKQRPTHYTIGITSPDGRSSTATIPVGDHPSPVLIYKFSKANILRGYPPYVDTFNWTGYIISGSDPNEAIKKYNWDGAVQLRTVPVEFARTLAKIGHSYAAAILGLNGFRPLTTDVILGISTNVSYVVGGLFPDNMTSNVDDLEAPVPDAGHLLELTYDGIVGRRIFIVVNIRLFASLATPTYHVVVGDVQSEEHVRTLLKHRANAEAVEVARPV